MTRKRLSQYHYLVKEIEHDRERLATLRGIVIKAQDFGKRSKGKSCVSSVEQLCINKADIEKRIRNNLRRCKQERKRLEEYIYNINDSQIRQIFTLRYIERLSWVQIAFKMGGNNEETVRKIAERYLNDTKNF